MFETLTPQSIILGPRPGKKSFDRLAGLDLTHCVTLLGPKETPETIHRICKRLGCEWLWMPLAGGNLETLGSADIGAYITQLDEALRGVPEPKIYVHCSAGIHRTGFFTYILLRLSGLDAGAALDGLSKLRSVTALQVGDERVELAETLLTQSNLNKFMK